MPPLSICAAKIMGAKEWELYLEVIIPSALSHSIIGMKKGWSFAWRSLKAGGLLIVCLRFGHLFRKRIQ